MYFFYYFPVGLDIKTKRTPVITLFLAWACVTVFIASRYVPLGSGWNFANLIFHPSNPSLATSFTYAFLHTGYFHLIGNIVYLYIFGKAVEDGFGPGRLFAIFALSAVAGAWTHLFLTSRFSPEYLRYGVIGCSGATSGLLGAFLMRFYYSRVRVAYWIFMPLQGVTRAGRTHVPVILAIAFWLLYQGVYAVMQYGIGGVQVAYGLHIGGFACGALLATLFGALSKARSERRLVKARRNFEKADWFAAQAEYIEYLALAPDDAAVHAEAARTFLCSGDRARARYHFTESVSLYLSRLERGKAEDIFESALRAIPGLNLPQRIHLDLAFRMERSMKFRAALTAYENFTELYPNSEDTPFVLLRTASLYENRFENPVEAYACYSRIVDYYPDDPWTDFASCQIERLKGMRIVLDS